MSIGHQLVLEGCPVPIDLDEPGQIDARVLTDRIKQGAELLWADVALAFTSSAWADLGYASWDQYTAAEFGSLRLRLPMEERQGVVASLREAGMSLRAISSATGVSEPTVRRTLATASNGAVEPEVEQARPVIVGTNGKRYAPPAAPVRAPKSPEQLAREREAEDAAARVEAGRQFRQALGQQLFILKLLDGLPERVTEVVATWTSLDPPITADDLEAACSAVRKLTNEWRRS